MFRIITILFFSFGLINTTFADATDAYAQGYAQGRFEGYIISIIIIIVCLYFGFKALIKNHNKHYQSESNFQICGFKSWLILLALFLTFGMVIKTISLINLYLSVFTHIGWEALNQHTNNVNLFCISLISINMIALSLYAYLNYLFFSKKRIFPKAYFSISIFYLILNFFDAATLNSISSLVDPLAKPIYIQDVNSLFILIAWSLYLFISKQAKTIFVN